MKRFRPNLNLPPRKKIKIEKNITILEFMKLLNQPAKNK